MKLTMTGTNVYCTITLLQQCNDVRIINPDLFTAPREARSSEQVTQTALMSLTNLHYRPVNSKSTVRAAMHDAVPC